ncbi:MAG: hypothetical protein EOM40_08045 [Clostridia bacterium]|nr:hypothetical protein [Clostridia bacterium]
MKRKIGKAVLLAVVLTGMVMSPTTTQAANGEKTETTTVKTTVESVYNLMIPVNPEVEFGSEQTDIGSITVKGNIDTAKKVVVSASKTDFTCTGRSPFSFQLQSDGADFTKMEVTDTEASTDNGKNKQLSVVIPQTTWNTVKPGTYTAVITFRASLENIPDAGN